MVAGSDRCGGQYLCVGPAVASVGRLLEPLLYALAVVLEGEGGWEVLLDVAVQHRDARHGALSATLGPGCSDYLTWHPTGEPGSGAPPPAVLSDAMMTMHGGIQSCTPGAGSNSAWI